MTDLRKALIRRTIDTNMRGRRIVVCLEPGDVIAMREERTRKWFRAPIARVLLQIATWNANAEREDRRAARRAR